MTGASLAWQGGVPHLDLRGLEPPRPAVAILTFLADPEVGDEVIVHLARDPVFLYPELMARGWEWQPVSAAADDVVLRLIRKPGGGRP